MFKKGDRVIHFWKTVRSKEPGTVIYVEDDYRIYVAWDNSTPNWSDSYSHNELRHLQDANDILKAML